jgi:hypothetical protein
MDRCILFDSLRRQLSSLTSNAVGHRRRFCPCATHPRSLSPSAQALHPVLSHVLVLIFGNQIHLSLTNTYELYAGIFGETKSAPRGLKLDPPKNYRFSFHASKYIPLGEVFLPFSKENVPSRPSPNCLLFHTPSSTRLLNYISTFLFDSLNLLVPCKLLCYKTTSKYGSNQWHPYYW